MVVQVSSRKSADLMLQAAIYAYRVDHDGMLLREVVWTNEGVRVRGYQEVVQACWGVDQVTSSGGQFAAKSFPDDAGG